MFFPQVCFYRSWERFSSFSTSIFSSPKSSYLNYLQYILNKMASTIIFIQGKNLPIFYFQKRVLGYKTASFSVRICRRLYAQSNKKYRQPDSGVLVARKKCIKLIKSRIRCVPNRHSALRVSSRIECHFRLEIKF